LLSALAQAVKSALPSLRRYACALVGSTRAGDCYVEICLETIVQDTGRLSSRQDVRLALFKVFHEVICVFEPMLIEQRGTILESDTMQHRIVELPFRMRQALLLAFLEEFSCAQISEILDISADEVLADLTAACGMLMGQCRAGVLTLEGDAMAAIAHHTRHAPLGIAGAQI